VEEPGFQVTRQEGNDRHIFYQLHIYATETPLVSGTGNKHAQL
jgi:hypothetical protein